MEIRKFKSRMKKFSFKVDFKNLTNYYFLIIFWIFLEPPSIIKLVYHCSPSIFHHQSKGLKGPCLFEHYPWIKLVLGGWCLALSWNLWDQWSICRVHLYVPLSSSTKRNKALINIYLPLRVLPTTPTLLPSLNVQAIPLGTSGTVWWYLI